MNHSEVAEALEEAGFDRATLYRNLVDLAAAGILNRSDYGDHSWRFELAGGDEQRFGGAKSPAEKVRADECEQRRHQRKPDDIAKENGMRVGAGVRELLEDLCRREQEPQKEIGCDGCFHSSASQSTWSRILLNGRCNPYT